MTHKIPSVSMKATREAEFEAEHADLQRRWNAFHRGETVDMRSLVEDTKHLERVTGMAPGQLLDGFRKGEK
jgi:hypothetical protein